MVDRGQLVVERVFPVSFLTGAVVWGAVRGEIAVGDVLTLARQGCEPVSGEVVAVDFNRPADAPDDHFGFVLARQLADVVAAGDVLVVTG